MHARKARMVMGDIAHGDDPAQEKIERRQVLTFRDLGREYIEMAERWHKRWTEEKRIIEKDPADAAVPSVGDGKPRAIVELAVEYAPDKGWPHNASAAPRRFQVST